MGTPSNVIRVPRAPKTSYNPQRPLVKNTLLLNQVRHFREVEKTLPPEMRSGIDFESIKTEGDAAEYVRRITAVLHPQGAKVKKAT
ncbi:MAG: hypothetical protein JO307_34235 [Bryobacterales bacterium]|nr:hypothetical protein [Bryobacterales bacterium]MBV9401668.1 hypothetical protein [Bryobacterales bacterium]